MISPIVFETDVRFDLAPVDAAFEVFRQAYPAFDSTRQLDELRATEYARLDRTLRDHLALLCDGVFGNPHSKNLTSLAMTHLVEQTRDYVLRYFTASPDKYLVIFTPNSTGALRASIGLASNFADVCAYVQFARTFIDTLI